MYVVHKRISEHSGGLVGERQEPKSTKKMRFNTPRFGKFEYLLKERYVNFLTFNSSTSVMICFSS